MLAFAVSALSGLSGSACGDRQLRKISAPRDGVQLAYAFEPATAYAGKVDVGITRQVDGIDGPIKQSISGDVTMVVLGDAPEGGTRVRVTLTQGDLDWALLPESGYSREVFLELAVKRLKGLRLLMTIGPLGQVTQRPSAPDDVPPELVEVIDSVIDGVAQSFIALPDRKLSKGERWVPAGPGRVETRFRGLFRHLERDEDVARLELEMSKVPIGADLKGERQGSKLVLFATAGYPARTDLEARDFDPKRGMSFRRVRVEWTKTGRAPPELIVQDEEVKDVQVITDPCNPDYVGPAACEEPDARDESEDDDLEGDTDDDEMAEMDEAAPLEE